MGWFTKKYSASEKFALNLLHSYPDLEINDEYSTLAYLRIYNIRVQDKLSIDLRYNLIRNKWEIQYWNIEDRCHLFFLDYSAAHIFVDHFGLQERVKEAVEQYNNEDLLKERANKNLINDLLKG